MISDYAVARSLPAATHFLVTLIEGDGTPWSDGGLRDAARQSARTAFEDAVVSFAGSLNEHLEVRLQHASGSDDREMHDDLVRWQAAKGTGFASNGWWSQIARTMCDVAKHAGVELPSTTLHRHVLRILRDTYEQSRFADSDPWI